ncbi:hypothetical protein HMPREF1144_4071 [Klebsiella sp. OBRC7]|nr:hypothetical protein HMPREF1144_4071 [Klebsiella sp. OBRC7]
MIYFQNIFQKSLVFDFSLKNRFVSWCCWFFYCLGLFLFRSF